MVHVGLSQRLVPLKARTLTKQENWFLSQRKILWTAHGNKVIVSHVERSKVQSTLVISKSKGVYEILRDIRSSTYHICRIEEKVIRTTTFNKYICNLTLEVRDILKILWKRGEIAPQEPFLLFSTIFFFTCR